MIKSLLRCSLPMLLLAAAANADTIYSVTIGTAPLAADSSLPFYLAFELADGSGTGDGDNAAVVTNVQPGEVISGIAPTVFGNGVSGDLSTSVQMTDIDSFEYFAQPFFFSNFLSFQLDLTTNVDTPAPDTFLFWILDSSQAPIPTLATDGLDEFAQIIIDSSLPTVQTYASDISRQTSAGETLALDEPEFTVNTPEPAGILTIGLGLFGILALRRARSSRR